MGGTEPGPFPNGRDALQHCTFGAALRYRYREPNAMKVRIDKAALMTPLYRAQGAADQRQNTSVIGCVHLRAEDDGLVLSATDYEVTVVAEISADVIDPGTALVNAKGLYQLVRAMPDGATITLTADANHRLRIEAGRAYYYLNGLSPEEFPQAGLDGAAAKTLVTDKAHIESMLKRTLFSVSSDDGRPAITGILLEIEPEAAGQVRLRMVSTDGHRLSKCERLVAAPDYDGGRASCIVHRRCAAELQRLIEGSDPSLRLEFIGRNLVFASDRTRLQVRQIEANFPDYTKVVPDRGDVACTLPKDALAAAIRRVTAMSQVRSDTILKMEFEIGRVSLDMHSDFGEGHEELEIDTWSGASMRFGFNPRFLLDVCTVLPTENLTLEMRDQISPCLLHSDEEPGTTFVIMPMRL